MKVSLTLDDELGSAVQAHLAAEQVTVSECVRSALRIYLAADPARATLEDAKKKALSDARRWAYGELWKALGDIGSRLEESLRLDRLERLPIISINGDQQ
jgi:hypothetical protein